MGIPDYLYLHPELADRYEVPCIEYQTRLFANTCRFTIDIDGTLIEHRHGYEPTGQDNLPFFTRIELGDRQLRFHGDLRIYGRSDGVPVDLVVRFTDGQVAFIKPWSEHPEELRQVLCPD